MSQNAKQPWPTLYYKLVTTSNADPYIYRLSVSFVLYFLRANFDESVNFASIYLVGSVVHSVRNKGGGQEGSDSPKV